MWFEQHFQVEKNVKRNVKWVHSIINHLKSLKEKKTRRLLNSVTSQALGSSGVICVASKSLFNVKKLCLYLGL